MAVDFLSTSSTDKAGFGGQVEAGVLLGLTAEKTDSQTFPSTCIHLLFLWVLNSRQQNIHSLL